MTNRRARYHAQADGHFIINNYNWASPFSSFLPGIAGRWGIPMWVYYVSKAQAIISAGVRDKDGAILEFTSFNKACQTVDREGFRTFIKLDDSDIYEPFRKVDDPDIEQRMVVSAPELEITDRNPQLGLETRVSYFPLTGMPVAGLIRQVELRNLGEGTRWVELIDGLPRVLPAGTTFEHTKAIARHIEAMMGVFDVAGIPVFKLKQTPADTARVGELDGGNYYLTWMEDRRVLADATVVDPAVVFGLGESHDYPWRFASVSAQTIRCTTQTRQNRTPCAFTVFDEPLGPGETLRFWSILGHTENDELIPELVQALSDAQFFDHKRAENRDNIERVESTMLTVSGAPHFDAYCHQTFLDNTLRGGMPILFPGEDAEHVFHIYGRQNGDLERDYHWFELEPTYLSQGNGHYRNVVQDRRMDAWFFPQIGQHDVKTFIDLIQLDGYNPLVIVGQTYTAVEPEAVMGWLVELGLDEDDARQLSELTSEPFTPGEFIKALERTGRRVDRGRMALLAQLLSRCRPGEIGEIHVGYWIDHWFYNVDLIDTYLMVFPDRRRQLLLEAVDYTFYDNPDVVQPRDQKLVLSDGQVRQYNSVIRDERKAEMINARWEEACKVRTRYGRGEIYTTNLFVKLLCVLANKMATLDPRGVGVEMEAGRPGWCDSLNGLPGLLGSSICAALELQRLGRFLLDSLSDLPLPPPQPMAVFEELAALIAELDEAIEHRLSSDGADAALMFWEASHRAVEHYRATTRFGVSGRESNMAVENIKAFVERCVALLELPYRGTESQALFDHRGIPFTYFINDVKEYDLDVQEMSGDGRSTPEGGQQMVKPLRFEPHPVAPFLEGPVHYLRTREEHPERLVQSVRESGLFDGELTMFKCCDALTNERLEIGRIKAHAPGWLENESIYMHMAYKWLLEILRAGAYDLFFEEVERTLVPFLDPAVYGRSPFENCSFMVGSAFPDETLHGQACQPRLSGVNAEMLNIWVLMVAGPQPFFLDADGQLAFRPQPALAPWLFTTQVRTCRYWDQELGSVAEDVPRDAFAFLLLGQTLTVYHNHERRPTFGPDRVQPQAYEFAYRDGTGREVEVPTLGTAAALDLRQGLIRRMDICLG